MKPTYIKVKFIGLDSYHLTFGPYDSVVEMNYDIDRIKDGSYSENDVLFINHKHIAYIVMTDRHE